MQTNKKDEKWANVYGFFDQTKIQKIHEKVRVTWSENHNKTTNVVFVCQFDVWIKCRIKVKKFAKNFYEGCCLKHGFSPKNLKFSPSDLKVSEIYSRIAVD